MLQVGKFIAPQTIKARYLRQDDQHKTVKDCVVHNNTNMTSILKYGTMKNHYFTERYLHKFIRDKFKTPDVYLK